MGHDVRDAVRALWRSPLSSALIVIALGLGIGVNTAIFSLVDVILFRPLAVPEPERLVRILASQEGGVFASSLPSFMDYRDGARSFSSLAAFADYQIFHLSLEGQRPERVYGTIVTGRYFETLGVHTALGRTLGPADDGLRGTGQAVVLSDACWRRRFGADPRILGQTLRLNGETFSIVGVLPPSFHGANVGSLPEVFIPMSMAATVDPAAAEELFGKRDYYWLDIVGRLAPGVMFAAAQAEMEVLGRRRLAGVAAEQADPMPLLHPATNEALDAYYRGAPRVAGLLLAIVALVLGIACADAAALLLARGERRRREMAIRLAIGASRGRIVRQLLVESVALAALGSALGLFLAHVSASLIVRLVPEGQWLLPADAPTAVLDPRVLAFTMTTGCVVGIVFGLFPAFRAARTDLARGLASEGASLRTGGGRLPLGGAFIVGQVALTCVLLVGAGLLVRSLHSVLAVEPGYDVDRGAVAYFDLATQRYDVAAAARFESELLRRVRTLPEVERAALGISVPLQGWGPRVRLRQVEGYEPHEARAVNVDLNVVTPGFFETLGVPFVAGRDLTGVELPAGPLTVAVNQAFARQFWPGGSALGRTFVGEGLLGGRTATIVGVVKDYKLRNQREEPRAMVFGSLTQFPRPRLALVIRAHARPAPILPVVRRIVAELDPDLPLFQVSVLRDQWSAAAAIDRLLATLLTAFASLALVLAAAGLFGLLSYGVEGRRREIGLRMALGAQAGAIVRLVVREGLVFVAGGLVLGLAASLAASRILNARLFGVSTWDPVAFAAAAAVLVGVALLAAHGPARRAARVDPMTALRSE